MRGVGLAPPPPGMSLQRLATPQPSPAQAHRGTKRREKPGGPSARGINAEDGKGARGGLKERGDEGARRHGKKS